MSNRFRVNTLVLSGQSVTANSNSLFVNGVQVQGGSNNGVTGLSISGGVAISGAISINAGSNVTLNQAGTNSFSIISNVPNGLLSTGSHSLINSVTGVSISGGLSLTGAFNINAGSNITLTQQGSNTLSISSTSAGGSSTNGVTGISVTGIAISGHVRFLAGDGIEITQDSNIITIGTPIAETGGSVLNGQLLIGTSGENSYIQGDLCGFSGIVIVSGSGTLGVGINSSIVTSTKLESSGTALQNQLLNYVTIPNGSPAFVVSGGITTTGFTLSINSGKVVNNFDLTFTSGSNRIDVSNAYNGCIGVVLINKNYTGLGITYLPTFSKVVDIGTGTLILPTGVGNHIASFIYSNASTGWWTYGLRFT